MPVAGNLRGRDIVVELSKTYLKVGVKGQKDLIIDVGSFPPFFSLLSSIPPYETSLGLPENQAGPDIYIYPWEAVCLGDKDD